MNAAFFAGQVLAFHFTERSRKEVIPMDMELIMLRIRAAIKYWRTPSRQRVVAVTKDGKRYYGTTDGKCEACGKRVANRECAHGILCDKCDEQIHGSVGGKCEVVNS